MRVSDEIAVVQQLLRAHSYSTVEVTGCVDSATQDAVRRFQASHELPADGRVGAELEAALRAVPGTHDGPPAGGDALTGCSAPPGDAPPWPGRVLHRGISGQDVEQWERVLHERRGFTHLRVGGTFDDDAARSCRWLELYLGRTPTETVDEQLWRATWRAP